MLKKTLAALAIGTALLSAGQVMAADYKIDKEGQHAFIDWKISTWATASSTVPSRIGMARSAGMPPSLRPAKSRST